MTIEFKTRFNDEKDRNFRKRLVEVDRFLGRVNIICDYYAENLDRIVPNEQQIVALRDEVISHRNKIEISGCPQYDVALKRIDDMISAYYLKEAE